MGSTGARCTSRNHEPFGSNIWCSRYWAAWAYVLPRCRGLLPIHGGSPLWSCFPLGQTRLGRHQDHVNFGLGQHLLQTQRSWQRRRLRRWWWRISWLIFVDGTFGMFLRIMSIQTAMKMNFIFLRILLSWLIISTTARQVCVRPMKMIHAFYCRDEQYATRPCYCPTTTESLTNESKSLLAAKTTCMETNQSKTSMNGCILARVKS